MGTKNSAKIVSLFAVLALALFAHAALAATLSVSSASTKVVAGDIVTVRISVNAGGQAINTAEGTLQFPTDVLEALSLDKSSSIFSIWVEDPSFSNSSGQVSFSGGLPSPGYSGGSGTVLTVSFRAKRAGSATLSLADATVRANDGLGTDVLQSTGALSLTVVNAPAAPAPTPTPATPAPAKTPPTPAPSSATTAPAAAVEPTPAPVLYSLQGQMEPGDQLSLSGHAPPEDAQVYVYISKDGANPSKQNATPDITGAFSVAGPTLEEGTYAIFAQGISSTGILSEPTETMTVRVGNIPRFTFDSFSIAYPTLVTILLVLLGLMTAAAGAGWYLVYKHHRHRRATHHLN